MPSRLALGTVQFGLPYGITNKTGQVSADQVAGILEAAWNAGVDTLDTAIAYGDSEQCLGSAGVSGWRVVSKLGEPGAADVAVASWVRHEVLGSLSRLRISRLAGLLLHRPAALRGEHGQELYAALLSVKRAGLVEKIGVSIYDPDELADLSAYAFDLVQAPFNVVDQRIVTSGWLHRLKSAGTEVHTRSVFLQGLLLLRAEDLPDSFARWRPLWHEWNSWLKRSGYSATQACLGFATAQAGIDRVIVGVENVQQLREAITASTVKMKEMPSGLSCADLELISPARWRLQ